ncbi:MAG: hypothetical protein SGI73_08045 [Chloroflexota bacterium]|nr:hypothetical protein [Chloroflexota bacterium]
MPTLTIDQIASVRAATGDTISPYDVTDAQLQTIYDDPAAANSDLARLHVYVLRRRLGKAANLVALGGDGANTAYQQRFAQLGLLLAYWERLTALDGGALSAGTLMLDLDEDE